MPSPLRSPSIASLAIAACAMELTAGREVQLLPAGTFRAGDGRPTDAPAWTLDAALAENLIAAAAARTNPYVIDYEHQTLLAKQNGQPAPASGWYSKLEWREGVGLFAVDVDWTEAASAMIEKKEYRYISPVIGYDKSTGAVTSLHMAAITNNPAIDGMNEVLLTAAALCFSHPTPLTEDTPNMDEVIAELLEQLRWMFNLPVGCTPQDVAAHLEKVVGQIKDLAPEATAAASFDLTAFLVQQRDQLTALSTAAPDPAKYVPIAALTALQAQVATLSGQVSGDRVEKAVTDALAGGKLVPAMEGWARDLGKKDFAALSAYLDAAPTIVAPGTTQTGNNPPKPGNQTKLTESQAALCRATGVSEENFLATLAAETTG